MYRFNPTNLRQLDLNDIDFQQDTNFSDEESLEEFKMKAKRLIKSAFNTPTRRQSKSIIHTGKNSSQKQVKFNEVKIEKDGDSLYVSEMKLPFASTTKADESIMTFNDSSYFPSLNLLNQNKKQKKLLITQRDSLLSSQPQISTRSGSLLSPIAKDDINLILPSEFKIHEYETNEKQPILNQSFDALSYYSENCKSLSKNVLKQQRMKRSKSAKESLCQQEYDLHNYDDPVYVKQKQIDTIWQNHHGNILELNVINKYQCRLETLVKYLRVKWMSRFEDKLFPPSTHSLASRETSYNCVRLCNISWKPLYSIIDVKKSITLGQCINSRDIMTNNWHHNYFIDLLSALAEQSDRIKRLLDKNHLEINQKGCFSIRINCKGVWRYILTDDYVPIFRMTKEPIFCQNKFKAYRSIDIWPFMIEKALASYYGSYESLEHANIAHTLFDLTGAPYEEISLKEEKVLIAAVEKANSMNWITMVKACSDDKDIEKLTPVYRLYAIHQVQTTKRVKQLVVELKSRDDNGYFKYCTFIKDNWDIMPTDFQDYALEEAQSNYKIFITYEELVNRFDKLVISKIYDDYYYVCTRIKQTVKHSCSLYKLYLQNQSQFYLQVNQFDKRKMARNYQYLPCRVILSKFDPETSQYIYRSGFHSIGRDISQEFNCEAGEYLVSVLFETQDSSNLFEATLSYYGDQKTYFDEIPFGENQSKFQEQFSQYAKNQIQRKIRLGAKYLDSNCFLYTPPATPNSFEKFVWFDKVTGMITEVYSNPQLVAQKFAKNTSDYNQTILSYIQYQNNSQKQQQQQSLTVTKQNNATSIQHFQVQSGQDYAFIYTVNDYPQATFSKLKQSLKQINIFNYS